MSLQIIRAMPDLAAVLTDIAHEAKRHWGYPAKWIDLWREGLTVTTDFIADHEVYAAIIDGEISGFSALVRREPDAVLEHLWVRPAAMGRGLGRALFLHAVRRGVELGAESLAIEADPNAEGFYRRMGAERAGERVTTTDGQRRVLPLLRVELTSITQA